VNRIGYALLLLIAVSTGHAHGQGLLLPGVSPRNLGMGGAATAAPIDAIGAIYWNTATISAMENEMAFSMIDVIPHARVSSSVAGFGAGSTDSESGGSLLPGFALVYQVPESPWTMGLAAISVAGSRVNYPASLSNPVFTPEPNTPGAPGGTGGVNATARYSQFTFALSYAINEDWAIGAGPTVTYSDVTGSPLILGRLDDSDGSGQPRFSRNNGHASHWGGGVQAGVFYTGLPDWNFGAAVKSEPWIEDALWNATDELGRPFRAHWNGQIPTIYSIGASYTGCECAIMALDVKYLDYTNASGCGDKGFGPDGRVLGLAQVSTLVVSLGTEVQLTDRLVARLGYTYNTPTQGDDDAMEAVFGPFFYQHTVHVGGSVQFGDNVFLDASYSLILPAELNGQIVTPEGPVPGSSLDVDLYVHFWTVGVTVKY
jgi:long-chain fatty acid transport protein